jgi:hypothetical protein
MATQILRANFHIIFEYINADAVLIIQDAFISSKLFAPIHNWLRSRFGIVIYESNLVSEFEYENLLHEEGLFLFSFPPCYNIAS